MLVYPTVFVVALAFTKSSLGKPLQHFTGLDNFVDAWESLAFAGSLVRSVVFAVVAAIGVGTMTGTGRVWVGMIGLSLFIASFAIGVGGTGWLIQGEMFPTAVRGQAASIAATVDWVANYALIEPTLTTTATVSKAELVIKAADK